MLTRPGLQTGDMDLLPVRRRLGISRLYIEAKMYDNYKVWVANRILTRCVKRENGCIEYQGNNGHKYGLISITIDGNRKSVPAHRALWMAMNDRFDLPREIQIRHKCDNTRCVNIEHLIEGTSKQNMQDCIERGRRAKTYAYAKRHRIHDNKKIEAIRNASGKHKYIADQHGVSIGYVSKIKNGMLKKQ